MATTCASTACSPDVRVGSRDQKRDSRRRCAARRTPELLALVMNDYVKDADLRFTARPSPSSARKRICADASVRA